MDINEVQEIDQLIPPGEAVSPEQAAETPELAAPEPDEDQEIARLREEVDSASTPDERTKAQAKMDSAWAKMRRETKAAKDLADERQRLLDAGQAERDRLWQLALTKADAAVAPPKKEAEVVVPELPPEPQVDDFDDYETYMKAWSRWDRKVEKMQEAAAAPAAPAKPDTTQQDQAAAAIAHQEWLDKCKAKFPDFETVALKPPGQGGPWVNEAMADLIKESEFSAELAYYLGKNPKESKRIYNLTPVQQAREFGKLEGKLTTKPSAKPTQAPSPIAPVGGGPGAGIDKPLDEVSTDEFIERRNREEYGPNWRRRA